ncbi:hypothetical protein GCM10009813_03510 [Brevibacterium marinum]
MDCINLLERWGSYIQSPMRVQRGSLLGLSDARCKRAEVSTVAWQGISIALEHVLAVARIVKGDVDEEFWSPYLTPSATHAFLRSSQLAASRALWILDAESTDLQANRALEVKLAELRNEANAVEDITKDKQLNDAYGVKGLSGRVKELERAHGEILGLLQSRVRGWKKTSDTGIIKTAAKYLPELDDNPVLVHTYLMSWRMGSGSAHGYFWPTLMRGFETAEENGVLVAKSYGDLPQTAMAFMSIVLLLNRVLSLYEQRSAAF